MEEDFATLRAEYSRAGLSEADLAPDPLTMFATWFEEARVLSEPNAMVLATVSPGGQPAARTVLLKELDDRGFAFFTNLESRKGAELFANPRCSLLFPWHPLQRQVRVEGLAVELSRDEVAAYFATRPRGAQLGAWASAQSSVVTREELEQAYADVAAALPDEVPVPEDWGGFVVTPRSVEFWQGRANRMHDRWRYRRPDAGPGSGDGAAAWTVERLAP